MKKTLNAWLRPNLLTDDPNDFVAVPVIVESIGITEIIAELKKEGMEIKTETAVDIITRFNRKTAEMLTQGYSVNTGCVYETEYQRGFILSYEALSSSRMKAACLR